MLRSLDIFSGIGGLTRALEGLATPVSYCEKDQAARSVMETLMRHGKLPRAPVADDVCTLKGASLKGKVDMIVAGIPCTGFSLAGSRAGFENEQSGLYSHVVRLVREIRPSYIFLENVPGILTIGIDKVCKNIGSLGYDLWWIVVPASAVGSPQHRKRWFCLAVNKTTSPKRPERLKVRGAWKWFSWAKETVPRMCLGSSKEARRRIPMLGNAVVPDCARLAFLLLWTGCRVDAHTLRKMTGFTLTRPAVSSDTDTQAGACLGKGIVVIEGPKGMMGPPSLGLVLDPKAFGDGKGSAYTTSGLVKTPRALNAWGTPRHAIGYCATNSLTVRSAKDLGTQVRFERGTPDAVRPGFTNPQWVEWLMGFPKDWTK